MTNRPDATSDLRSGLVNTLASAYDSFDFLEKELVVIEGVTDDSQYVMLVALISQVKATMLQAIVEANNI